MNKSVMMVVAAVMFAAFVTEAGDVAEIREKVAAKHRVTAVDRFHGFDRVVFDFDGHEAWICCPPGEVKEGKPWSWVMQWATAFVPRTNVPQLLRAGYHHVTINTFSHRMDETGLEVSAAFQKFLVDELGFAPKAYLIGMSWGGFFSIRYTNRYPENVAKIYLDAPLLCFKDFRIGIGPWDSRMPAGGWATSPEMPVNMAESVAKAGVPILLLYGGADQVVPPPSNCEAFIPRFKAAGGDITVMKRAAYAHHPHGVEWGEDTIKDFFERKPVLPVAEFKGEVSASTPGWKITGKDGERLECATFKLDKSAEENAFYRLVFEAKAGDNGYWWVDMDDTAGRRLPDVNSRLYATDGYQSYDVMVPMRPEAVTARISFVCRQPIAVRDVKMIRVDSAAAAQWMNDEYAKLPAKLEVDVPGSAWAKLPASRTAIQVAKKFTTVFLGDSIMNDTWCGMFDAKVRQEYPDTEFKSYISVKGSTGCWYYREPEHFEEYVAKYKPDLVVIGGISNYRPQQGSMTEAQAVDYLVETANRCRAIGAEVVIASPARYAKATEPGKFEVAKAAAEKAEVQFWDLTTAPNAAVAKSGRPTTWFDRDAIHSDNRGKLLNAWMMWLYFNAAQK